MSFLDWLDIASHVARLIGLLVSPAFVFYSLKHWSGGDIQRATLWAVFALLVVRP